MIQTERLTIRPLLMHDLHILAQILADPDTMLYVGGPKKRHEAREQLHRWMTDYEKDGYGFMALLDRYEETLIGYGGFLHQVVEGKKYIELGYCIAKEYWGQGYATEAARALKKYGLHSLGFSELISIVHKNNIASQRVSSKIGMTLLTETTIDSNPCYIYHCLKGLELFLQ
jgi:[ribosomal protein S5]-alanine N-acetyltransferase